MKSVSITNSAKITCDWQWVADIDDLKYEVERTCWSYSLRIDVCS